MLSPEQQQIEICILKSNLEEIEKYLIEQRSAMPALDAENDQKCRETMTALRVARSLNAEAERLRLENVRLTANRQQLQRQCDDINATLEGARGERGRLLELLRQEEQQTELEIRKYEDSLREVADRFRSSPASYNEKEMKTEVGILREVIDELREEEERRRSEVVQLRGQLEALVCDVPADLLTAVGKTELDEKLKSITSQCQTLQTEHGAGHAFDEDDA